MKYGIVYECGLVTGRFKVIEESSYGGEEAFTVHSRHEDFETAALVKEALENRQARENS